jgi:hypothetical protein
MILSWIYVILNTNCQLNSNDGPFVSWTWDTSGVAQPHLETSELGKLIG